MEIGKSLRQKQIDVLEKYLADIAIKNQLGQYKSETYVEALSMTIEQLKEMSDTDFVAGCKWENEQLD